MKNKQKSKVFRLNKDEIYLLTNGLECLHTVWNKTKIEDCDYYLKHGKDCPFKILKSKLTNRG